MNLLLTTKILEYTRMMQSIMLKYPMLIEYTNRHFLHNHKKQKKIKNNQIQAPLWGVIILLGGLIGFAVVIWLTMLVYQTIMH